MASELDNDPPLEREKKIERKEIWFSISDENDMPFQYLMAEAPRAVSSRRDQLRCSRHRRLLMLPLFFPPYHQIVFQSAPN